jgi:hypothetical protein
MIRPLACALVALAFAGACRGRDAALAELKRVAATDKSADAEALAAKLAGSDAEPAAQVILAEMYVRTGDPAAATKLQRLSQRLSAGNHHAALAAIARQQGRLAWAQSRYLDAIEAFDRSVWAAKQVGDRTLEKKGLLGLFTMLQEVGDLRGARAALKEAARDAGGLDDELRMTISFNEGLLAAAEDQLQTANTAFKQVLQSPVLKPGSEIAWNANLNLLALALEGGHLPLAEETSRAVETMFASGPFKQRSSSRIARGLYAAQLERLRHQPRRALALLQSLAVEAPSPQWQWRIALEQGRAYMALEQTREATDALEESARIVEALRGDQMDDFKSWVLAQRRAPFEALFELHVGRGDHLAALQIQERVQGRTFIDAFAVNDFRGTGAAQAPRRIEALRKIYPALRASAVLAAPLPVQELRALIGDVEALAFFETKQRLFVLSLHDRTPVVTAVSAPLATVRQLVARFLAAPDDPELATQLGTLLLPERIPPHRLLHIIPSPSLGRVPFAALRRNGRCLVEDHVLAQVPSLNALVALRRHSPTLRQPATILANAAGDLPQAEAEAQAVATQLGPNAQLFLGAQASAAHLREGQGASVLHLAVHSGVGPAGPFLDLADGPLLAGQLLEWRIAADLVVLASCASAATADPGLWGSLVASFLASGSPSVVGSLWSTEDSVSRTFVERFYAEGGAQDPAGGLARTQRAWLAERRPTGQWAAFTFYGAAREAPAKLSAARGR